MSTNSLMAIAAHCDDIELNFGATLLKYHEDFDYEIFYVLSTNNMSGDWSEQVQGKRAGRSTLPAWIAEKRTRAVSDHRLNHTVPWYYEIQQRKKEAAIAAADCFHTEPIHLDYAQRHYTDRRLNKVELRYGAPAPDCYDPAMPTIMTAYEDPAQVTRVAKLILDKNPEVVLTHAVVDYTFEHTGTTLLVRSAFYEALEQGYDGSLVCSARPPGRMNVGPFFERWDTFIDTAGFLEKKNEAIGKHACQIPDPDRLDLFDRFGGQLCGCESIEPYTVAALSRTRSGPLTEEFTRNHRYCNENWMQLFFSDAARQVFDAFREQYTRNNAPARPEKQPAGTA